ncbi:SH3 domain-containing protein [Jhaorihella thermophila]|uniref:SH3-like domain-containing protein n=1 Tax=Jhaorihella thermophila TaxID=488547 RepID=A0A1H5T588_9RHOB|nr:SH3 domain-containing protein [Jhaorihella thermophila]SEF57949.1 SH3-like domain-containing protein [Jhaorihella thermophila]
MTVSGTVKRTLAAACAAVLTISGAAGADGAKVVPAAAGQARGPVTNLPLPRFVSLKTDKGNARRGPSLTHRIDWVFTRRGMPLQVTAEYGHWRRVRDRDGQGGWVHYALLSGVRTVLVEQDMLTAHALPNPQSPAVAAFELGVVARLGDCIPDWCEISAGGHEGWVPKTALWGVAPDEIRD